MQKSFLGKLFGRSGKLLILAKGFSDGSHYLSASGKQSNLPINPYKFVFISFFLFTEKPCSYDHWSNIQNIVYVAFSLFLWSDEFVREPLMIGF